MLVEKMEWMEHLNEPFDRIMPKTSRDREIENDRQEEPELIQGDNCIVTNIKTIKTILNPYKPRKRRFDLSRRSIMSSSQNSFVLSGVFNGTSSSIGFDDSYTKKTEQPFKKFYRVQVPLDLQKPKDENYDREFEQMINIERTKLKMRTQTKEKLKLMNKFKKGFSNNIIKSQKVLEKTI